MSAVWAARDASEFHALVSPLIVTRDDVILQMRNQAFLLLKHSIFVHQVQLS